MTTDRAAVLAAYAALEDAYKEGKARAIADAAEGPIMAAHPASILQMHPDARLCIDEDAARLLERADYYRWVFDNKPGWQAV